MKKLLSIIGISLSVFFVFPSCASMIKNPAIHVLTKSEIENQKKEVPLDVIEKYSDLLQNSKTAEEIMELYNQLDDYNVENEIINLTNNKLKEIALINLNSMYINVDGDDVNIYEEALDNVILVSIDNSDISILLNWLDDNRKFSQKDKAYSIAGSLEERHVLFTAIKIEDKYIKEAIESKDTSIINKYFENNPYKTLPNDPNEEGRYRAWENVEKELISFCEETIVYNQAVIENNFEIYTSKYENGRYDVKKIGKETLESE